MARYTVLGWLATGGMSELYLARQAGPSGFHRVVVLKVILPHLAEDRELVQMFENEAKVAALLNHPNVVQISDFGSEGGLYYLTMEYIDGQPLSRVLRKLNESGQIMPVSLACRLTSDATAGLAYAHDLRDAGGERLQVMHRDVSLENILLSYAGQVKVVDFGLAKARTLISLTRHGTLKGKYRYMAPEMISGATVDHRIDIFALGVVLYALSTGTMPFEGGTPNDLLLRIVRDPPTPPRSVNPRIPAEVEQIILRALEKDPARRYPHASELQKDLESYMMRSSSVIAPYQLAQFMSTLFPPGTDRNREAYQQMVGVTSAPSADLADLPTMVESVGATAHDSSSLDLTTRIEAKVAPTPRAAQEVSAITIPLPSAPTVLFSATGPPSASAASLDSVEERRSPPGRIVYGVVAVAAAALIFLGGAALYTWIAGSGGVPPAADGRSQDRARPRPDAAAPATQVARVAPDAAPPLAPGLETAPPAKVAPVATKAPRKGRLTILVWPYGTVTLDGTLLGATPLPTQLVPQGTHQVVIENRELGQKRTLQVHVRGGREAVVKVKLQQAE